MEKKYFMAHKLTYAPALTTAFRIGEKSREVKFDWENANQVLYKVEEEWQELKEELYRGQVVKERVQEELGDLLFSMAQLARHLGCDPEETLRAANDKFIKRFNKIEDIESQTQLRVSVIFTDLAVFEDDNIVQFYKNKELLLEFDSDEIDLSERIIFIYSNYNNYLTIISNELYNNIDKNISANDSAIMALIPQ